MSRRQPGQKFADLDLEPVRPYRRDCQMPLFGSHLRVRILLKWRLRTDLNRSRLARSPIHRHWIGGMLVDDAPVAAQSVKGPSFTLRAAPSKSTRLPSRVGRKPSQSLRTPAFLSLSLNAPIAAIDNFIASALMSPTPFSRSGFDLTRIRQQDDE